MNQLFISPSYIPIDSSVTLINARIIDKLEEYGVNTIVLTMSTDDIYVAPRMTITPKLSEIFKSTRKAYRLRTYESGGKLLGVFRAILRKTFPIIFYLPDYHFLWVLNSILKLPRIKRENKVDIVHSVSSPYCSHVVGYFAKKILRKPWICHLDDFWVDQYRWSPATFNKYLRINMWLEKKCFEKADIILSSSREILQLARERYPSQITKKFAYIPPGYNPKDYPHVEFRHDGKYKFTFSGFLYADEKDAVRRDPNSMFEALQLIRDTDPDMFRRIEVNLIGVDESKWNRVSKEHGVDSVVRCFGRVDYRESIRNMKEASVLLHFGIMSSKIEEDIFVSGKIFEYFGANRLILGITTPTGPVADIIRQSGGVVCDYRMPQDIAGTMKNIIVSYSLQDLYNRKNPDIVRQYTTDAVASAYVNLMRTVVDCHP